jgi:nitrogen regulatory protein PII
MYMIMYVLDDPNLLDPVLDSWSSLGVTGVTIMESTGLHRRKLKHIPMRYEHEESTLDETYNSTLFAIVQNKQLVDACLTEVEKCAGDLNEPNTGVFAAWPLPIVKGVSSS